MAFDCPQVSDDSDQPGVGLNSKLMAKRVMPNAAVRPNFNLIRQARQRPQTVLDDDEFLGRRRSLVEDLVANSVGVDDHSMRHPDDESLSPFVNASLRLANVALTSDRKSSGQLGGDYTQHAAIKVVSVYNVNSLGGNQPAETFELTECVAIIKT